MQFILYFKSSWLQNSLEGIESILPLPPKTFAFSSMGEQHFVTSEATNVPSPFPTAAVSTYFPIIIQ